MLSSELWKMIRCVDIEKEDGKEVHHFEIKHVSYSPTEEPDHVIWLPAFMIVSSELDGFTQYGYFASTNLGKWIKDFMPFTILWDVPPSMTIHEYMKLLSCPPSSTEH